MRLKLTLLGTLWVALAMGAWIWLGVQITEEDAAYFYWSLGLLVNAAVISIPFILFKFLGDDFE